MSSASSFRVKIPRTARPAGARAPSPTGGEPTDVPGTFITAIPPLPDADCREVETTAVNPPYSYARVSYNDRTKEFLYEVIEPQLSHHERELVDHLKSTLGKILGSEVGGLKPADKRTYLRQEVESYLASRGIALRVLVLPAAGPPQMMSDSPCSAASQK